MQAKYIARLASVPSWLNKTASLYVPQHCKNFYKFWWNEDLSILKEESITYNKLWKASGKPRCAHIFDK